MKIALTIAAFAISASAQTVRVAGVIVDSQSGSPLPKMRIKLISNPQHEQTLTTESDGQFSFDAAPGKYSLVAERRGWRQTFGSNFGSSIIARADQDTAHLQFRWFAPGAIFGKVVDDLGDPVENAIVYLIRESIISGKKRSIITSSQRTDDRGDYRFAPVVRGTYFLAVTAEPWYLQQPMYGVLKTPNAGTEFTFSPSFYPGATGADSAAPLTLAPGSEIQADFTLKKVPSSTVKAICPTQCHGAINLYLKGIGDTELLEGNVTVVPPVTPDEANHGAFVPGNPGIPPGHYIARFTGPGLTMRKPVEVGAGETIIEVAPQKFPTVSGKVAFADPQARPRAPMYMRLINQVTNAAVARTVERDGSFSWATLAPGRYRPQITNSDGFILHQITTQGGVLKDGILEISDGEVHLSVVVSNDTGRMKGFVKNADTPIPGALVVLVPATPSTDASAYRSFETDSDGSFDFLNVRAGDYILLAIDNFDLEYANPDALKPYLSSAKRVRIEPHTVQSETLGLSTPQQ